jgi:hypothetical protein
MTLIQRFIKLNDEVNNLVDIPYGVSSYNGSTLLFNNKNEKGEQAMENTSTVRIVNVKAVNKAEEKIIIEKTLFIKMIGSDAMYKERAVRKLLLENPKAFATLKEENIHFIVAEESSYAVEEAN